MNYKAFLARNNQPEVHKETKEHIRRGRISTSLKAKKFELAKKMHKSKLSVYKNASEWGKKVESNRERNARKMNK